MQAAVSRRANAGLCRLMVCFLAWLALCTQRIAISTLHLAICISHFGTSFQPSRSDSTTLASMWSLSDFQLEVNATSTLLKARPGEPQLLEGLGASLKHKLEHMSLSTADVVACYDLVKACDLPQCLQTSLQSVLDTKALGSAQSALTVTTQAQQFDSIPAYLTQSEITKLENCNPFEGACVLASRCKLVGVKSLKESTKKVMTALLIRFDMQRGGRRPEGDCFYRLSQHVRTTFANSATPNPPECLPLKVYPADPAGLSPKHFQAAYPEEKPVGCQFVGLATVMKDNHVRSTGLSLRGTPSAGTKKMEVVSMGPQEGVLQQPTGNLKAWLENFINRSNSILAGTLDTVLHMHPQSHLFSKQGSVDALSCSSGEQRGERMALDNGAHLTMTTPTAHTAVAPVTKASEAANVPAAPSNNLLATLPQTQPQAALENNERTLEDWEEDAFAKLGKKSKQVVVS